MKAISRWLERLPRDAALNLAVFRIVVALLFLTTAEVRAAASWSELAAPLAAAPRGWGWALALVPANALAARTASVVVWGAAFLGIVGLWSRAAFTGLTIAALYLLALPLRAGLPFHDQHLVWFAALCAASPCGDALSIDRWLRARAGAPPPARSIAYGVPLRVAWLLVGVIFFFPGLWKLRASGLAWITSDNLQNQLYWKWATTPGLTPPVRIDRFPWLLHAGAAGIVALELSFVFAVWWRTSRAVAVAAALAFHAGARLFMGIDFSALWLTYVVFVDWNALTRRWARAPLPGPAETPAPSRVAPALVVGAVLLAGAVEAGARGATTGWPFACYPTFQARAGTVMPALTVAIVTPAGEERALDVETGLPPAETGREHALALSLLSRAAAPESAARFAAYWRRLAARAPAAAAEARAVRFYAVQVSTRPEDRSAPPRARMFVYELVLPVSATMMPRARSGATTSRSSDDAASVR